MPPNKIWDCPDANPKESFPYQHLPRPKTDIRQLIILPKKPNEPSGPIIAKFKIGSLKQPSTEKLPEYEALSYVWTSDRKGKIRIYDGKERKLYPVSISKDLESCLRKLRYDDRTRCIWVDSLCINQVDDDEKSYQVSIMGEIYALASHVCVWLGDKAADSSKVFPFVKQIIKFDNLDNCVGDPKYTRQWRAFGELMRRKCMLFDISPRSDVHWLMKVICRV